MYYYLKNNFLQVYQKLKQIINFLTIVMRTLTTLLFNSNKMALKINQKQTIKA